ncbi:hypothetical protein AQUCO_07600137v1 [Aquilegia coerulea]|uniref:SGNH hydrolase-type esterase domain-containing protein n=1 Tax=Aquilegia coerulea TaxID=218851 RepID=A0A2G5C917_AQUCA|nr:hypothetical protein AQUCO_07600137v1 [Aquilegia coerulea]
MVGPQRPQFVLFGSSIVQLSYSNGQWWMGSSSFLHYHLSDIYSRKADIILRGYNGWNSRRGLKVVDQVFPKDAAVQPDLVIVYFGGNDIRLKKIALHIRSLSEKTRVIFRTCPPVNEEQFCISFGTELVRSNEDCQRYSNACLELCRDIGGSFIVVEEILKVLKEAKWEPSLYWKSLPTEFTDLVADDRIHTINVDEWTLYREHWH